jgi:hypothetical protein
VFIVFGEIELRDFVSTVRSPHSASTKPRKGAARLIGQKRLYWHLGEMSMEESIPLPYIQVRKKNRGRGK